MNAAPSYPQDLEFRQSLFFSILLHASIVLVFTVKVFLFPSEDLDYQSAVRVDIVALPDKLPEVIPNNPEEGKPQEAQKLPQPDVVKTEPAKPQESPKPTAPTVSLKKTDDKKLKALEKIKKLTAVEKIKEQLAAEKLAKTQTSKVQYKGNVLSAGTELTGVTALQHDNYKASIDKHVKGFWNLPQWLAQKPLSAQVRVFLDEKGQVTNAKIIKSSGHPTYDENVLEAIKNASPFPAPPEKFIDIVAIKGIVLGFPE